MSTHFTIPRLLPTTIAMLAIVLAAKGVAVVRTAAGWAETAIMIPAAAAAGHDAPADPPPPPRAAPRTEMKPEAKPDSTDTAAAEAVSDTEKAVLLDLRQRRLELEARDAAITNRESTVSAAEARLTTRVDELRGLRKSLEGLEAGRRQQEDGAWQGLVKVYESMKPHDAATIFNDLSMPVLLSVVDRMKEAKAAAILAAMAPDRAREVTTKLAQSRTRGLAGSPLASGGETPPTARPAAGPPKPPGSGT